MSVSQPEATAATRLIAADLRASSVAGYWASACSLQRRDAPEEILQEVMATPAWNRLVYSPVVVLGWRVPLAIAFTVGNCPARWTWNWARACSTLSMATRRSRLLPSAMPMRRCRRGSLKYSFQSMSAAARWRPASPVLRAGRPR